MIICESRNETRVTDYFMKPVTPERWQSSCKDVPRVQSSMCMLCYTTHAAFLACLELEVRNIYSMLQGSDLTMCMASGM